MDSYKERIKKAVESYSRRQLVEKSFEIRKNKKPEQSVVKQCILWMRHQDWSVYIIEAKSKWNFEAESYSLQSVPSGFSDCVGAMPTGRAVFVEFKAKGRRSTLKEHQRVFLEDKINKNCFACCVDSLELLNEIYLAWKAAPTEEKKKILLNYLPKKKEENFALFD